MTYPQIYKTLTLIIVAILFNLSLASACDITFEVIKGKKEVYSAGDELVVKIHVLYTHRVCPEGIKATKFKSSGLKITGSTKWKTLSGNSFERKIKLKVKDNAKTGLKLSAVRTCDKTGGFGEITFKKKS